MLSDALNGDLNFTCLFFFLLLTVSINLLWSEPTEENEGVDWNKVHSMSTFLSEQQQKQFKVV